MYVIYRYVPNILFKHFIHINVLLNLEYWNYNSPLSLITC